MTPVLSRRTVPRATCFKNRRTGIPTFRSCCTAWVSPSPDQCGVRLTKGAEGLPSGVVVAPSQSVPGTKHAPTWLRIDDACRPSVAAWQPRASNPRARTVDVQSCDDLEAAAGGGRDQSELCVMLLRRSRQEAERRVEPPLPCGSQQSGSGLNGSGLNDAWNHRCPAGRDETGVVRRELRAGVAWARLARSFGCGPQRACLDGTSEARMPKLKK